MGTGYSWVDGFVPPAAGNTAPDAPTLNAPTDGATGIGTSPTLDVGVSDPDADALTVTYYGRPYASGNFAQIAQHTGITGAERHRDLERPRRRAGVRMVRHAE